MNTFRIAAVAVSIAVATVAAAVVAQDAPALTVTEVVLSKTVEAGRPGEPFTTIPRTEARFYVFVRVNNPARTETSIKVSIERPGQNPSAGGTELSIPAQPRYRTFARFPARRPAGHYRAVVRDAAGAELGATEFDVTE